MIKIFLETLKGIDGKFSSKKLTLFLFVLMFLSLHISYLIVSLKNNKFEELEMVMIIEISFIASLIGLNGYLNFLHFKTKNETNVEQEEEKNLDKSDENKQTILNS